MRHKQKFDVRRTARVSSPQLLAVKNVTQQGAPVKRV